MALVVDAEMVATFWQTLTDSVVRVESLEAAELVKLINNSYRVYLLLSLTV